MNYSENIFALVLEGFVTGISLVWNAIITHPWVLIIVILGIILKFKKRR